MFAKADVRAVRIAAAVGLAGVMLGLSACAAQNTTDAGAAPTASTRSADTVASPRNSPVSEPPAQVAGAPGVTQSPTSAPASASQWTGIPGKYVPGAWLSPQQLPLDAQAGWRNEDGFSDTKVGGNTWETTDPKSEYVNFPCVASSFGTGMTGAQYQLVNPPTGAKLSDGANLTEASQHLFFYQDAADAQTAWKAIDTGYQGCGTKQDVTDPSTGFHATGTTRKVLAEANAVCWSDLTIYELHEGDLSYDCFAARGNLIEDVTVLIGQVTTSNPVNFVPVDTATAQAMEKSLSAYGD